LLPVDVWIAIINAESRDEEDVGVYTTEELALATAKRVSPEAADVKHCVLDKVPEWVEGYDYEQVARELGTDRA
jgi:hypothetical protein